MGPREVVGVDGAKSAWVAIRLIDGRFADARRWPDMRSLLDAYPDAAVIGVDIPIGLVETGRRTSDSAARSFLGRFRSTVFQTPPRRVIESPTYAEALALSRELEGHGISTQSYGLRRKILEMDRVAEGEPRLHEVHPEVSFKHMAGHGLRYPKRSPQGMAERRELLAGQGIEIPAEAYALRSVAVDDLFDAAAAAWSAQRIATGEAGCLPADAATGEHGRPIAIWY